MAVLEDLKSGGSIQGILPSGAVTVVSVQWFGSDAIELTYKDSAGWEKGVQPPAEAVLL